MPIRLGLGLSPVLAADRLPWTPGELSSLRAWYDAELGQPKNVGYVQLDGTSGDYIYTPDSTAVRITGAFEVVMRVYCNDWTAAGNQTLMGRYVTSTNLRSFRVFNNTAGTIGVAVSSDGTSGAALLSSTITPSTPLPDATWFWLRTTFLPDDGGGNRVASLFTAPDTGSNALLPVSWTANGVDTDAGVPAAHFAAATAPLEIGSFNNGALERFSGRIGRAILYSDLSGPVAADFNASDCYGNGYWHSGGYQWTLGLPKIYDRSGNGVAPATFGSGSNQPKWLPWLGVSCVHLESASTGTNSVSCTAPSGAASYVARSRDYPNVADDTGAAAAGAFAFTTAGQWQYISILNGSAVEIARFDASLCTQTGMTDSYSVAWTVNRGTASRKTVVQSPAARSARSVILHGTDDWIDVPAAAVPALDTFAAASSVTASFRRWHNPGAAGHAIFATKASLGNAGLGTAMRLSTTATSPNIAHHTGDGAATDGVETGTNAPALGARTVQSLAIGNASPFVQALSNGKANGTDTSRTTTVTTSTGGAGRIGAYLGGSGVIDMEFETLICRDAATTEAEHGLTVAYLGGGL